MSKNRFEIPEWAKICIYTYGIIHVTVVMLTVTVPYFSSLLCEEKLDTAMRALWMSPLRQLHRLQINTLKPRLCTVAFLLPLRSILQTDPYLIGTILRYNL